NAFRAPSGTANRRRVTGVIHRLDTSPARQPLSRRWTAKRVRARGLESPPALVVRREQVDREIPPVALGTLDRRHRRRLWRPGRDQTVDGPTVRQARPR